MYILNLDIFFITSKPAAMMARNNFLREPQETFRGSRIRRDPILIWLTPEHAVVNNVSSITVYYIVKECNWVNRNLWA